MYYIILIFVLFFSEITQTEINQDDLILQQQRNLEKEVSW